MNIFRFIGDHDSLINVLVLLLKIYITKSWSGVSLKTQELYAMVLLARYLDLFGVRKTLDLQSSLPSIVSKPEALDSRQWKPCPSSSDDEGKF
ncbi:hypothetical protein Sjap_022122 [Stephania japonica]|uniref:Uncharacterized protein n=1 Tax=Stephania japonica TaxID=461633 RepID=A0AAP0ENA6_9MAGN